jgi:hypothetical protein
MNLQVTTKQVWETVEKELFAVIGMVTAHNEARTVGVVYVVRDHKLYFATDKDAWKTRHIADNPHVSVTIPIAKHIPLMPWMKIPAATITFCATAKILGAGETSAAVLQAIFRGMTADAEKLADSCVIELTPERDFVTYGVGMSLMQMRDPEKARGRAPVTTNGHFIHEMETSR